MHLDLLLVLLTFPQSVGVAYLDVQPLHSLLIIIDVPLQTALRSVVILSSSLQLALEGLCRSLQGKQRVLRQQRVCAALQGGDPIPSNCTAGMLKPPQR